VREQNASGAREPEIRPRRALAETALERPEPYSEAAE
jgi:hypothetical protein